MRSNNVIKNAHDSRTELIELLYDTARKPVLWDVFMQRLVDVMGSRSARLLVMNRKADVVERSFKVAIDDHYHQQYVDYYVNCCPWRPELSSKPAGRLYSTYLDFSCTQKTFQKSEFFNDWARPQDITHGICGTIHTGHTNTIQLLVQRTKGQSHFSRQETHFVNALVPHMQRAFELAGQFQQAEAISMAVGQSTLPFMLLGEKGRILFTSQKAESLIAAEPNLDIRQHCLSSGNHRFINQLTLLIQTVVSSTNGEWHTSGGTLQLSRREKMPLTVMVTPVGSNQGNALFPFQRSFAALFFYDPEAEITLRRDLLESYYGLTPTEAKVAELLAQGNDLTRIASRNQTTLHTVRNQLKSIFAKTSTSRQAELVSQLLSGPAGLRGY